MNKSTLEQWQILQTIIEQGGFTAAADTLFKSQSSISYSIKNLQDQLGAKLIQINGKKVQLTDIGAVLLDDIRPLLREFENVELKAKTLISGNPAKITLEIDCIYPKPLLFNALTQFKTDFPHTQIELKETVRLTHTDKESACDLFIGARSTSDALDEKIFEVELIAVAHNEHPLLNLKKGELSISDLNHYTQVYLGNTNELASNPLELPRANWRVNTVESAIEAVKSQLCFGWLPYHRIENLIKNNTLCRLPLAIGNKRMIPLYLSFANYEHSNPAIRSLAHSLKNSH